MPPKKIVPVAAGPAPSAPVSGAFASYFAQKAKEKPQKPPDGLTDGQRKHLARMNNLAKAVKAGNFEQRYKQRYKANRARGIQNSSKRGMKILNVDSESGKVSAKTAKPMKIIQKKRLKKVLGENVDSAVHTKALFKSHCPVFVRAYCRKKKTVKK